MDEIDRVQLRLSGICDKCSQPLAEHKKNRCPANYPFGYYPLYGLWIDESEDLDFIIEEYYSLYNDDALDEYLDSLEKLDELQDKEAKEKGK